VQAYSCSDLAAINGWQTVKDPYTGREVYVIPAIRPDVAVIHVNEADELGNAPRLRHAVLDHPRDTRARNAC